MTAIRIFFALAAVVLASPHQVNHHHHQLVHRVPQTVAASSTEFLCDVTSNNVPHLGRDVGMWGKIGDTTIFSYGDTMDLEQFYMTTSSSAIGTNNPCVVHDAALTPTGDHPAQFIPMLSQYAEFPGNTSLGGSNVIGVDDSSGMIFYVKSYRPNHQNRFVGTGVGRVTLNGGIPTVNRQSDFWWSAAAGEPHYGVTTAYTYEGYIWAFGSGGPDMLSTYVTRVPTSQWQDLSAYEYYNGATDTWQKERLYHPGSELGVQGLWGCERGQMFWSDYYQKHMIIYMLKWPNAGGRFSVWGSVADHPRGPWSEKQLLFEVNSQTSLDLVYCSVANPNYDPTHKTIVVTVCNGSAKIQAFKVTFA